MLYPASYMTILFESIFTAYAIRKPYIYYILLHEN